MKKLGPLVPLLLTAGVLLGGNGMQGTLIALRGAQEGFDATAVGIMGTSYYVGYILSCLTTARMVRAVGHIRVFSALAAIAAAGTLMMVLWIDQFAWIAIRAVMGFCFAGLFLVVESWLNERTTNRDRATVLSIYRLVDLASVTGSQFVLPLLGTEGFTVFAVAAMMTCLSLVPVSLADRSNPQPPEEFRFSIRGIWAISPLACFGCITVGLTNSAFRLVGPLYASGMGLDTAAVALFMSAGILGGAALQLPLGWLSDRWDRRWVLITTTVGAAAAGLYLSRMSGHSAMELAIGVFIFGAFALPLYSLSAAHANDRAKPGQYVILAAGLSFFFSIGAGLGPLIGAAVMQTFGTPSFFVYTSVVHLSLVALAVWRMLLRPQAARSGRFVALLRFAPHFLGIGPTTRGSGQEPGGPGPRA